MPARLRGIGVFFLAVMLRDCRRKHYDSERAPIRQVRAKMQLISLGAVARNRMGFGLEELASNPQSERKSDDDALVISDSMFFNRFSDRLTEGMIAPMMRFTANTPDRVGILWERCPSG